MAIDTNRAEIEKLKHLIRAMQFEVTGYNIDPDAIRVRLSKDTTGVTTETLDLYEAQVTRLLRAFNWELTGTQRTLNALQVSVQKLRTLVGIL